MQIVPLSAFSDNYIWAIVADARCVVVDPGEAAPVERFLHAHTLTLEAILITHHHGDHTGGIAALAAAHRPAVFGPAGEAIKGLTQGVKGGDQLTLLGGQLSLRALDVPGHTAGHIAYVGADAVFCGDTLFSAGCGRLFEGSAGQLHASLTQLASLPDDTAVCCAHEYTLSNLRFAAAVEPGNPDIADYTAHCQQLREAGQATLPSRIGLELRINPFLRCGVAAVRDAASRHAQRTLHDDGEVFAALRSWKNDFR